MGGAVRAVESGFIEQEIQDSAYQFQKAVESNEQVIVGVNKFQTDEKFKADTLKVDPAVRDRQIERIKKVRAERDSAAVDAVLGELKKVALGTDNLMAPIMDAVKKRASLGEICDVLRGVFGEYTHASKA